MDVLEKTLEYVQSSVDRGKDTFPAGTGRLHVSLLYLVAKGRKRKDMFVFL